MRESVCVQHIRAPHIRVSSSEAPDVAIQFAPNGCYPSSSSSCTCACLRLSLHPGHSNERVDVSIAPAHKKTSVTASATDEARTMLLLAHRAATHSHSCVTKHFSLKSDAPLSLQIMALGAPEIIIRHSHPPLYTRRRDTLREHLLLVLSHNQSNCVVL